MLISFDLLDELYLLSISNIHLQTYFSDFNPNPLINFEKYSFKFCNPLFKYNFKFCIILFIELIY
jgi:hypothetical protein